LKLQSNSLSALPRLLCRAVVVELLQMTGKIDVGSSGLTKLALNKDGIDFAAVSLQPIPAGEYVPLLFTARNLTAEASAGGGELRGMYDVPSYRGATFMDPKVSAGQRGMSTAQLRILLTMNLTLR
jgi:photosystem II oxygen-evolving enhancer protein 1